MVATHVALTGNLFLEHPVSGYRIERFDRTVEYLRSCDVTIANLEGCVQEGENWPAHISGAVGSGTYMAGKASMIDEFRFMGIDALYAGSNHAADFGESGIATTARHLRAKSMPFAGLGNSLTEASEPCYVDTADGRRVGIVSICDFGPRGPMDMLFPWAQGFLASDDGPPYRPRPGLNLLRYWAVTRVERATLDELRRASAYLGWEDVKDLRRKGMLRDTPVIYGPEFDCEIDTDDSFWFMGRKFEVGEPGFSTYASQEDMDRLTKYIREARRQADIVVVALHDQSHSKGPSVHDYMRDAAYASIDNGADVFLNTGGMQRGVEVYKGKVIIHGQPSLYLQNDQITHMPASAYRYWRLGPDSTVSDLLDARSNNPNAPRGGTWDTDWDPVAPTVVHEVVFDDTNQPRQVRVQALAVDQTAPRHRFGLPLWPTEQEAKQSLAKTADLCAYLGTELQVDGNVGVVEIHPE